MPVPNLSFFAFIFVKREKIRLQNGDRSNGGGGAGGGGGGVYGGQWRVQVWKAGRQLGRQAGGQAEREGVR